MNKPNYDKMIRMQKKTKETDLIPTDKILNYSEKELRGIANNQIRSLKRRKKLTGKSTLYNYEINKLIKYEKKFEKGEVS